MIDCATHGIWCGDWTSHLCVKNEDPQALRDQFFFDTDFNSDGNAL